MNEWLNCLTHYFNYAGNLRRLSYEIVPSLLLLGFIASEVIAGGWKRSSLSVFSPAAKEPFQIRSNIWDVVSTLFFVLGIRRAIANLIFLGLIAFVSKALGAFSFKLFDELPFVLGVIVLVVLYDFLFYWFHRLRHQSKWIWNVHEFHHSTTWVNSFTRYRVHPLDLPIHIVFIQIPLQLVFGFDFLQHLTAVLAISIFGYLNHCRLDLDLGWLGRNVFCGPRYHHLHHRLLKPGESYHNYGEVFVVWDRLFGTYQAPAASLEDIEAGLLENIYVGSHPIRGFVSPILRFYAYPFQTASAWFSPTWKRPS